MENTTVVEDYSLYFGDGLDLIVNKEYLFKINNAYSTIPTFVKDYLCYISYCPDAYEILLRILTL